MVIEYIYLPVYTLNDNFNRTTFIIPGLSVKLYELDLHDVHYNNSTLCFTKYFAIICVWTGNNWLGLQWYMD